MESWYKATSLPLILGGATSEIYIGANTDAIPTPMPPISLAEISTLKFGGIVEPKAEIKNSIAASIKIGVLPYLSLKVPAMAAPVMAPTSAELVNHPN